MIGRRRSYDFEWASRSLGLAFGRDWARAVLAAGLSRDIADHRVAAAISDVLAIPPPCPEDRWWPAAPSAPS